MCRVLLQSVVLACVLGACGDWRADPDGFTEADHALFSTLVLGTPRRDPSNPWLGARGVVEFGQQLFFDRGLSSRGTVACTDCHSPKHWFSDARDPNNVSVGVGTTERNSPSLVNVAFYGTFGWDGRADTLWGQCSHAYSSPRTMGGSPRLLLTALSARYEARYFEVFREALPPVPASDEMTPAVATVYQRVLQAWAAYLTALTSTDAPFDRFARGERDALSVAQRRGLKLFIGKAGCIECHRGPNFSDDQFHSVGIGQTGAGVPPEDLGRYTGLQELARLPWRPDGGLPPPARTERDLGTFRTKGLRQISQTGPYFHAGQAETLKDVVWFYTRGGDRAGAGTPSPLMANLGLDESEQADLVSFLESLTGGPVPSSRRCDPSVPYVLDGGVVLREFELCPL